MVLLSFGFYQTLSMKNQVIVCLCILLTFFGCDQINSLTQFDLEYNEEIVIPSVTGIDIPLDFFTPEIESNSESNFAVNDTKKDLIEFISLKSMRLTLTDPDDEDFSFLESINIYINADGLDEQKIASLDDVPENPGSILDLKTSGIDLQEYIKKDKFTLRVNTVTDEIITSDHHIDVESVFFVDAKIFGI